MKKQVVKLENFRNLMEKYGGKIGKFQKYLGKKVAKLENH